MVEKFTPHLSDAQRAAEHLSAAWKHFVAEFPSEEHCLKELYRRAFRQVNFKCSHCGVRKSLRNIGGRKLKCANCKKHTWLTAGTLFHHIRIARPWLAAIWLMERGINVSSFRFHKLVGIAYSTAWNIFKKLAAVIQSHMPDDALSVSTSGFLSVFCKRSRETPARAHPLAEETSGRITHEPVRLTGRPNAEALSAQYEAVKGSTELGGEHKKVIDLLHEEEVHFDTLCQRTGWQAGRLSSILTILELDGQIISKGGNRYAAPSVNRGHRLVHATEPSAHSAGADPRAIATLVPEIIEFIRLHFQGISRKYLQYYLAIYWCLRDRKRWKSGSLMQACVGSGPVRCRDTLNYATPEMARISPC